MSAPNYRFQCSIIDQATGETVIADFCSLSTIDQFGGCESVDIHVAAVLRAFQRSVREEFERREYPEIADKKLVTQTAGRIRAAAANKEPAL